MSIHNIKVIANTMETYYYDDVITSQYNDSLENYLMIKADFTFHSDFSSIGMRCFVSTLQTDQHSGVILFLQET